MELFRQLFSSDFLPHGTCYLWNPRIVWLHVISDAIITLSYYCIPLGLLYLVKRRRDIPFNWIFGMFGLFILGCGTTHLLEVWTVWHPAYVLSGVVKAITAAISLVTAVALVPLIPKVAALPGPRHFEAVDRELQKQITIAEQRESELLALSQELDQRVQKRTADLEKEVELGSEMRKALGDSQAQLTAIIQSATDAIITVDREQKILLFNSAAEKMFGCRSSDVRGQAIERFIPQRFRHSHGDHIRRFGETGISTRAMGKLGALWGLRTNGEEFPIEAAISQIESGGKKLFTVIIRDITERQRMEEALRLSEERFRLLLDGVKDYAIFMLDPVGRVLSWNDGAARLKGYSSAEIVGKNFACFYPAEDQAAGIPQRELEIALKEGKAEDQGLRVKKDGTTFWAYKIVTPMYDDAGGLRGFSVISRDISERRRQEEILREREQALELAPVLIRDMQDHVVTWNQSCENLYGFSKAEALGAVSHTLLRTEFPEPLPAIMERFRRDGAWIGELVHYRRDGSRVVVNSQWGLFSDEQGRPVRIVETNADISERKLVEQQIQELNAELEKRVGERTADLQATNKELEAFTYSVSHDLRAPLRHIAGFSKMLAEEYSESLAPQARHYLKRIQDGIHRMGTLVDDLLSLTRIGRHELRVQVTGVESIIKDVIAELAPDVEKREISWDISNLPYVEADPALLRVVFQNLLANAVKYTRPREKATIEVGQTEIDGERVLFVRDNGVGFNMKYADKLFGVFQRLHRAEDFEGTGVGLATVQRVVQKHGGRIWAEAELDKGATFYFTLKNTAATPAVHDAAKAGGGL